MKALRITAHLMSGFCSDNPYSPAIDGILGYALRREQLSDKQFALDTAKYGALPPVEGLPLAVERFDDDWWYQCSLPIYTDQGVFHRHIHRRFNSVEAEKHLPGLKELKPTKGPYKNARLLLQQYITGKIEWHAVGDKCEIERLLKSITHVGKRAAGGFGRVRNWEVSEDGDQIKARFYRPLPKPCANFHAVEGELMQWGIRPPAKNNQRLCIMPCPDTTT